MGKSFRSILGYTVQASDGDAGWIRDLLFDDRRWNIRHVVVATQGWLFGRRILVPPASLHEPDWNRRMINVSLTREQLLSLPDSYTDLPVSGQHRRDLERYSSFSTPVPSLTSPVPLSPSPFRAPDEDDAEYGRGDHHLRSAVEVGQYRLKAGASTIGRVEDFVVSVAEWTMVYLVARVRIRRQSARIVVPPDRVGEISWPLRSVALLGPLEELLLERMHTPGRVDGVMDDP